MTITVYFHMTNKDYYDFVITKQTYKNETVI